MARALGEALEREHREIDAGIEDFTSALEQGSSRAEQLTDAIAALRRHIYLEESMLFPPLRDAGMIGPIFVMLREHGEMWKNMDQLEAEMVEDPTSAETLQVCRNLISQLESHNAKEEQILYSQADDLLSAAASDALIKFFDAGTMPEGWVCDGASR